MKKFRRKLKIATILILALFISNCSLIKPNGQWARPGLGLEDDAYQRDSDGNYIDSEAYRTRPIEFQDGEIYANKVKEDYKDSIGDQELLRNGLALGLIPLTASVLGLAITGASGDAVTALSLTGATGLGLGYWFASPEKNKVYTAGYKAIGCAVIALRPLDLKDAKLGEELDKLNLAINRVESEVSRISESVENKKRMKRANDLLKESKETYRLGLALEYQASRAGTMLVDAVDEISADVDAAIHSNDKDLRDLANIINRLAQQSSDLRTPNITGMEKESFVPNMASKEDNLEPAMEELSLRSRKMAGFIRAVKEQKPKHKLEDCGVSPTLLVHDLSIEPSDTLTLAPGDARGFVVKGGKKPFLAQLHGKETGLKLNQVESFGRAFTVEASEDAKGNYSIFIIDSDERQTFVNVSVGK